MSNTVGDVAPRTNYFSSFVQNPKLFKRKNLNRQIPPLCFIDTAKHACSSQRPAAAESCIEYEP